MDLEDFLDGSAPQHRVDTLISCDSPSIPKLSPVHHNVPCSFILTSDLASSP